MYVFDLMVKCPSCGQEFYDSAEEVMEAGGSKKIPVPGTCFSMRDRIVNCTKCHQSFWLSAGGIKITSQRVR